MPLSDALDVRSWAMTNGHTAKIIILHGPSSSGKSTLARALQDRIALPFWHVSIDHLRDSGTLPSARIRSGEFPWRDLRDGFFEGFHRSLRAYAEAGNNLIVEHIFDTPGWIERVAALLAPFDVFFVGLHVPLPELIRREAARGDRPIGDAERDFHSVHQGMRYDFEVSSDRPVEENVEALLAAWRKRTRSAFFTLTD
jgi:chloramphenicol 3-O phosphotransferase